MPSRVHGLLRLFPGLPLIGGRQLPCRVRKAWRLRTRDLVESSARLKFWIQTRFGSDGGARGDEGWRPASNDAKSRTNICWRPGGCQVAPGTRLHERRLTTLPWSGPRCRVARHTPQLLGASRVGPTGPTRVTGEVSLVLASGAWLQQSTGARAFADAAAEVDRGIRSLNRSAGGGRDGHLCRHDQQRERGANKGSTEHVFF